MKVFKKIIKCLLFFIVSLIIGTAAVYAITEKREEKEAKEKQYNN